MRIIGLTGGVACGKSTMSSLLAAHPEVTIVDADQVARDVVRPGEPAHADILRVFGPKMMQPDGKLDRQRMRSLICNDAVARRQLNNITHPRIKKRMAWLIFRAWLSGCKVCVLDVPLLFETRTLLFLCSATLLVYADRETQIQRVMYRDKNSRDLATKLVDAQMNMDEKKKLATIIIDNSSSLEDLRVQEKALWELHLQPMAYSWLNYLKSPTGVLALTAGLVALGALLRWR